MVAQNPRDAMLAALVAVLPVIEAELEQREMGGPEEYQQEMRDAVEITRAAIDQARGKSGEKFG